MDGSGLSADCCSRIVVDAVARNLDARENRANGDADRLDGVAHRMVPKFENPAKRDRDKPAGRNDYKNAQCGNEREQNAEDERRREEEDASEELKKRERALISAQFQALPCRKSILRPKKCYLSSAKRH